MQIQADPDPQPWSTFFIEVYITVNCDRWYFSYHDGRTDLYKRIYLFINYIMVSLLSVVSVSVRLQPLPATTQLVTDITLHLTPWPVRIFQNIHKINSYKTCGTGRDRGLIYRRMRASEVTDNVQFFLAGPGIFCTNPDTTQQEVCNTICERSTGIKKILSRT